MKLRGGEWSKGDVIALLGLLIAIGGVVAAILAIPGMPKFLHYDSESHQAASTSAPSVEAPAADVSVSDVAVEAVNEAHPEKLGIRGIAHFANVGKVPITAGCLEANAILHYLVPGPNGPQMTPNSWRLLGQLLESNLVPNCTVQVGVGESKTFPIFIIFERPTEDSVDINLMVQFHKDALPVAPGRDDSRIWAGSKSTPFHRGTALSVRKQLPKASN